jgi:amino acid transporter
VLLAANPTVQNTEELDVRLISLLAILVITVVCFLHYFSRNSGLLLNLLFALYKIVLILVFIIAGGIAYGNSKDRYNDWDDQPVDNKDALAALIYIVYSYQGWENANYVCVRRGFSEMSPTKLL